MNNFLIYRSSAGSGKTYTLVKEYLKLILNDPESFKNVLAVTFTNKSASEMKSRIISSLTKLSKGEDEKLKSTLVSEGVKGNIENASNVILKNILHKYSYFSVSTIDSFFHKVIRSFARELKLQLGYNIELDQQAVLDKITDKLLDDAGIDKDLTGFLEDFIYYSIDDEKGWKIDLKIKELANEIFSERYMLRAASGNDRLESRSKLKEFIGALFAIKNEFEGRMKLIAGDADNIMDMYSLVIDDFPYKKAGFMNYLVNKIRNGEFEPGQRAREASGEIKKWFGKTSKPAVKAAAEAGLFDLLSAAVENYDKNFTKYNSAAQLVKTIYITGIFKDLVDKLKKYRDDNNVLLISDINNLLLNVISGEGSPFVYEKIGSFYRNFLIDEFQDTSTFQWQNFFPLIENSLSESNSSLIVGDVKQSIYRWRNGNMKLLLEDVKLSLGGFSEQIKEESLRVNYRSKRRIVEFNNSFFKKAAEVCMANCEEGFGDVIIKAYEDTVQDAADKSDSGYVNISFYKGDEETGVTSKEAAVSEMIANIKRQFSGGYRQRDMMILVRNNSDAAHAAHELIDAGLKVVSSDSLLLTNSPKIRLLINIFKYITDTGNVIARAEILYNYLKYLRESDADLNIIFTDHFYDNEPAKTLFRNELPDAFFEKNNSLQFSNKLSGLGLYDLAEELICIFGLGNSADTYLIRFLDVLKKYSDENNSDVYGFIGWWEENKADNTIIVPDEEDAIRVMTIHKAKGLQAPLVFIPFANWEFNLNANRNLIWVSSDKMPFDASPAYFVKASPALKESYFADDYSREAALTNLDNLNLMYVAFTRAEEKLFIGIPQKGVKSFNAGRIIYETLTGTEELSGKFDTQTYIYEDGDIAAKAPDRKQVSGNSSYNIDSMITGNIFDKIIVKPEFDDFTPEAKADIKQMKNRGVILHKALSLLNNSSEAEVDKAVNKLLIIGMINIEQTEKLKEEIKDILSSSEVKGWFDPANKTMNERDIILPDGSLYRPDKVILKENSTIIIDYKSGSSKAEHKEQINVYGDILGRMGYKNIEKYLYYINDKKIEAIK